MKECNVNYGHPYKVSRRHEVRRQNFQQPKLGVLVIYKKSFQVKKEQG